jgi:hypothetical protein
MPFLKFNLLIVIELFPPEADYSYDDVYLVVRKTVELFFYRAVYQR